MKFNEDTLAQQTTSEYLQHVLGWDAVLAYDHETFGEDGLLGRRDARETVLRRDLRAALERLNPGLSAAVYDKGVQTVAEYSLSQSAIAINQDKHKLMRDGVPVPVPLPDGRTETRYLRVIDFDDVTQNRFLAVRELWIQGAVHRRRADLVCFVNGLPVLFIELKAVHKDLRSAFDGNIADYKDSVPQMFHHNAVILLGNGISAKIGSITSRYKHFFDWKRLAEGDAGVVDMETLLRGVCSKTNLLDILENFIVFDDSTGNVVKIIAQNHQLLGVNAALESVRDRRARLGKLGVFWHTQGSGKSYSMVFFARKVHRKLAGSFGFLVLTDREDLDNQIYRTFAGCGLVSDSDDCRVVDGSGLPALLGQNKRFVFSLIQKFHQRPSVPYSDSPDLIVMTDEAHRTQGGKLALNLRDALPQASFIGFTGTPLMGDADDRNTQAIFGDYVSTYDFQRAVEDNATVPLFYDSRGEMLGITSAGLNEAVAAKLEEYEAEDVDTAQRLRAFLGRDYLVLTSEIRLTSIARDFVTHYSTRWESGKAMLVCLDKITAGRMHALIVRFWAEEILAVELEVRSTSSEQEQAVLRRKLRWMRETQMALVISDEQGEIEKFRAVGVDILPHRKLIKEGFTAADGKRIDLEIAFKAPAHPFRVAVVCAMWLTGFDVPSLATLYLDKPLRAHTLMQTIARANRVFEGKPNGLIVDYGGILASLRAALATFAAQRDSSPSGSPHFDPLEPSAGLLRRVTEAVEEIRTYLSGLGFDLSRLLAPPSFALNKAIVDGEEAINTSDETKRRFLLLARELERRWRASVNYARGYALRDEIGAIEVLARRVGKVGFKADLSAMLNELRELVEATLTVRAAGAAGSTLLDISRINFVRLRDEFAQSPRKNGAVQDLKALIEQRLSQVLNRNPTLVNLQTRYEEIVAAYNNDKDRATVEATFEALLQFVDALSEEDARELREGLDSRTLTLFDLLTKPSLTPEEREKVKPVARGLLETLHSELAALEHWRERVDTRAAIEQRITDYLYSDQTGLPNPEYSVPEVYTKAREVFDFVLLRPADWLSQKNVSA